MKRLVSVVALVFALCPISRAEGPREGSPLDHLPSDTRQLTSWGERPDFRHDGKKILFLSKVFGDVYEYEIATGLITPCTDHFTHYGFTRALYLSNGDVLLSGPIAPFDRTNKEDRQRARSTSYLSVLDKSFTKPPVPLNEHCDEGPAVSRHRLRIAWTHGHQDQISTADLVYENGVPKLTGKRLVLKVGDFPENERPHRWIETQNFVPPDDTRLTLTAYEIGDTANSEAFVLDLASGELKNVSRSPVLPITTRKSRASFPMENTPSWSGPNTAATIGRSSMRGSSRSTAPAMPNASLFSRTSRATKAASPS